MAASSGSPPQRPQEPAWKRLGLKLKFARETSEPSSVHVPSADAAVSLGTSMKTSANRRSSDNNSRPSKRRRLSVESSNNFDDSAPVTADDYSISLPQRALENGESPALEASRRDIATERVDDRESPSIIE